MHRVSVWTGGRHGQDGTAAVAAEDSERLGFVTLAQFLRQLPALSVLHDGGNGDERLRWVEPSELDDPTPYLLDGEFLLTAGLPFVGDGGSEEAVDAYVRRLVEARVGALGFGLEPYFERRAGGRGPGLPAAQPDPGGHPGEHPVRRAGTRVLPAP